MALALSIPISVVLSYFPKISEELFHYDEKTLMNENFNNKSESYHSKLMDNLKEKLNSKSQNESSSTVMKKSKAVINFRHIVRGILKKVVNDEFIDKTTTNLPYQLCPLYTKRKECQYNKYENLKLKKLSNNNDGHSFDERLFQKTEGEKSREIKLFCGDQIPVDMNQLGISSFK
jgi:hypothetical protein